MKKRDNSSNYRGFLTWSNCQPLLLNSSQLTSQLLASPLDNGLSLDQQLLAFLDVSDLPEVEAQSLVLSRFGKIRLTKQTTSHLLAELDRTRFYSQPVIRHSLLELTKTNRYIFPYLSPQVFLFRFGGVNEGHTSWFNLLAVSDVVSYQATPFSKKEAKIIFTEGSELVIPMKLARLKKQIEQAFHYYLIYLNFYNQSLRGEFLPTLSLEDLLGPYLTRLNRRHFSLVKYQKLTEFQRILEKYQQVAQLQKELPHLSLAESLAWLD